MDGRIFVAVTGENGKSKKHLIRGADDLRMLENKWTPKTDTEI